MSETLSITIEPSPELSAAIDAALRTREYPDASAIVREALYAWYLWRDGEKYLNQALSLSDDALFQKLGLATGEINQFGIENIREIIEEGKQWWRENEPRARVLVCQEGLVQRCAKGDLKEAVEAICVGLGALYGIEKAAWVSVIIARTGIATWWASEWHEQQNT